MKQKIEFVVDTSQNLTGKILLASPTMLDSRFSKSAIYINYDNNKKVSGIVFNKPSKISAQKIIKESLKINIDALNNKKINIGGPLGQNSIMILHDKSFSSKETKKIDKNIFTSPIQSFIDNLQSDDQHPKKYSFFAGYSGWNREQLNNEFRLNSWIVIQASSNIILDNQQSNTWERLYKIKSLPTDKNLFCLPHKAYSPRKSTWQDFF